jgi:hypothetical protein
MLLRHRLTPTLLVAAILLGTAASDAQPRSTPPPAPAPPATPALPSAAAAPLLRPVIVAPTLLASLKAKRPFEVAKLSFVRRDAEGPILQRRGRDYRLMEAQATTDKVQNTAAPLPVALQTKFGQRITSWRPGAVVPPAATDPTADHRSAQSPVKDQGYRSTCSSFATVAGLEALLARKTRVVPDLSENHDFNEGLTILGHGCMGSKGIQTWAAVDGALKGVCAESQFAYPLGCLETPPACTGSAKNKLTSVYSMYTPSHGVPDVAENLAHRADNVDLLEAWLASGHDIIYAVDVAGSDWGDGTAESGVIDVQVTKYGTPSGPYGAHAMLMVGYDRPGRYFIFKNSYRADTGHAGYLYLSYDYVQTYAWYGFAVVD